MVQILIIDSEYSTKILSAQLFHTHKQTECIYQLT